MLPVELRDYCDAVIQYVEFLPEPFVSADAVADVFDKSLEAILHRNRVLISYDFGNGLPDHRRIVCPYRLVNSLRGWYLIVQEEASGEFMLLRLNCIESFEMLVGHFTPDETFNFADFLGKAWRIDRGNGCHTVRIRFQPAVATMIDEVHWHQTQSTSYEPDGTLLFEAQVDGLEEITSWVLEFGCMAEVLEPQHLRQRVAWHANQMLQMYEAAHTQ